MKRVTLPIAVPAPALVPVHKFPTEAVVSPEAMPPLPYIPPEQATDPAFMPVPAAALPPPAPLVAPDGFSGFMDAALKARTASLPHALFWAQMAQAAATAELADRVEELVEFLGARDGEDAEGFNTNRLVDVLAEVVGKKRK